jgi:di/tricarboxylate transporter
MIVPSPEDFLSIELGALKITEPVTAGTDLLIALIAIILAVLIFIRVRKIAEPVGRNLSWFYFFLFMGLSTFAGALSHGLRYYLPGSAFLFMFTLMNVLSGVSSLYAQLATIDFEVENRTRRMKSFAVLLFICFIMLVIWIRSFTVTNIYVTGTFLFVLYNHRRSWKKGKNPSKYICYGILISFITAFVFLFKISLSEWFNHKDIAHVFIMISLLVMYQGAKNIHTPANNI